MGVPAKHLEGYSPEERMSRIQFLRRGAVAVGGAAVGTGVVATIASASGGPDISRRDREILQFAATLESLQSAFYTEALKAGNLRGEARQFAEIVGREERLHLAYLREELGSVVDKASRFRFGDAMASNSSFIAAAVKLEDTGLAAYNGQAENLSRATLRAVSRVISVEARHAAWIRGLAGLLPAPVPADIPISGEQAMDDLREYLK
jgi:rubrerythrin